MTSPSTLGNICCSLLMFASVASAMALSSLLDTPAVLEASSPDLSDLTTYRPTHNIQNKRTVRAPFTQPLTFFVSASRDLKLRPPYSFLTLTRVRDPGDKKMPAILSKLASHLATPRAVTSLVALAAGLGIYITQRSHGT